jgi:hypothetical protein
MDSQISLPYRSGGRETTKPSSIMLCSASEMVSAGSSPPVLVVSGAGECGHSITVADGCILTF